MFDRTRRFPIKSGALWRATPIILLIIICVGAQASLPGNPVFIEDFNYTLGDNLVDNNNPLGGHWWGTAGNQIAIDAASPRVKMTGGVGFKEAHQVVNYSGRNGVIWAHLKMMPGNTGGGATMWSVRLNDANGVNLARYYGQANSCRGRIGDGMVVTDLYTVTVGQWHDLDMKVDTVANTSEFFLDGASIGVLSHGTGPANSLGRVTIERIDYNPATGHTIYFDEMRIGEQPWNPTAVPAAPTILTPANNVTVGSTCVQISWQGELHDGYEVHITTNNSATGAIAWDSGQVTSIADTCVTGPLNNGTQYYVFVRLRNPVGWGNWSATGRRFTVSVSPSLPAAPSIITPTAGVNAPISSPVVRWTGAVHDGYQVRICASASPETAAIWDSGPVSSTEDYCDVGRLDNGPYYAFARLRNSSGWGAWSDARQFNINVIGPAAKKGWIFLRDDQPYHLSLLTKAREYHVNHLQISHDIMMYMWEPLHDTARRDRINQLIDVAHQNGIPEVTLWVHEIQFNDMPSQFFINGKVNLDDPAYWIWLEDRYELLFQVCPNADGLIFTFSENFEGVDFNDRQLTIHTGKSITDTFEQAIQTLWNVCNRHNKSLYIRTWHYAGVDRMIRDAVMRCDPEIWMMSKATGAGDWNMIKEDYDIIGTCLGHPEMQEFDVTGEYWGLCETPWAGIEYIKHLWTDFALPRGAQGVCARIDRDHANAYETPNRINMTALDILVDSPDIPTDDIYSYWSNHWFGQTAGPRVASALKKSFDITNASHNLPTAYSFSDYVGRDDTLRALFEIECVKPTLQATSHLVLGTTDYNNFRSRFNTAANQLGLSLPSTFFGDFSPTYSAVTNPICAATIVNTTSGLNPAQFEVKYSTDGGNTWTNVGFTYTAEGGSTAPYHITTSPVPFGQLRAGRNKIMIIAAGTSRTYTVRGLDTGSVTLGSSIVSDGIYHPQGGDGNTTATTAGGRSCRTPSAGSSNFYFQTDDGFAYDRSPGEIYLAVDYYGSAGSITPYYDSSDSDQCPLTPVYLSGGSGWRTAVWKLDDVGFGHRMTSLAADIRLYVGGGQNVIFISGVRLSYSTPAGMLVQPVNLRDTALTQSSVSLNWNVVPGATRYQVCRSGVAVGWPTTNNYIDSSLTPNTEYSYTVTAFDNSGNTSCASVAVSALTLSPPPTPSTVTSSIAPSTWQTSGVFQFTTVGGFGYGKVSYYQYVWDESPTHTWTGGEATWPALGAPSGGSWTVWQPTLSPTDPASGWLLREGTTTQRLCSEALITEDGYPTWLYTDQSHIQNSKAKIVLWPNLNIDRDTGMTVTARIRAADCPVGWHNTGANFGINLMDCPEVGVKIRPDLVQITAPGATSPVQYVSNGYVYHTYTFTMKNATPGNNNTCAYDVYRDGVWLTSLVRGPDSSDDWAGPWIGQPHSDAKGAWAYQWVAWNTTGAYPPTPGTGNLAVTASHYGSGYYLHLRGFNANGVPNGTLDLGPYYYWNGSTPVNPVVTDDGSYTVKNAIHVKWSPVAPTASYYEYAIGTIPGGTNVSGYTNVGLFTEVTRNGLNLSTTPTYYVTVRGRVGSNNYTASSNGIKAAVDRDSVGPAKSQIDSASAALYGQTVTAVFPDCAYITDGAGIRIVTTRPIAVGNVVDVAGRMGGSDGERLLYVDTVIPKGSGVVEPVCVSGRNVGGGAFNHDPVTGAGQQPVKAYAWVGSPFGFPPTRIVMEMPGLNNIGTLATVFGTVAWSDATAFYIDDGTRYDDSPVADANTPGGLRIALPVGVNPPDVGSFVSVTGIISARETDIGLCRLLLVRQQSDIAVLAGDW